MHHDDSYSNGGLFRTCFEREIEFWVDTESPSPGDVIVSYRGNTPVHVGLWWSHDKILHAREKTSVRFDRLKTLEKLSTKLRFLKYASRPHPENAGPS